METKLKISTMNCQNCVKHITTALKLIGVEPTIDLDGKTVIIEHSDEKVSKDTILATLEKVGYKADII